jgi:hypothetical protein
MARAADHIHCVVASRYHRAAHRGNAVTVKDHARGCPEAVHGVGQLPVVAGLFDQLITLADQYPVGLLLRMTKIYRHAQPARASPPKTRPRWEWNGNSCPISSGVLAWAGPSLPRKHMARGLGTSMWSLTPDLQYVRDPAKNQKKSSVKVLGLREIWTL